MARQVVDRAIAVAGLKAGASTTATVPLPGGGSGTFKSLMAAALPVVRDQALAQHLVSTYG
jgi:glycerol-3-phosphate dehydrogenase